MEEVVLSVPEMTCEECVRKVTSALSPLSGVQSVQTNLLERTVCVQYQPDQLSQGQLETALAQAGYCISS